MEDPPETLAAHYRAGLQRQITGRCVEIDTFTRDEDGVLAQVLQTLEVPACEAPRASGLRLRSGLDVDTA